MIWPVHKYCCQDDIFKHLWSCRLQMGLIGNVSLVSQCLSGWPTCTATRWWAGKLWSTWHSTSSSIMAVMTGSPGKYNIYFNYQMEVCGIWSWKYNHETLSLIILDFWLNLTINLIIEIIDLLSWRVLEALIKNEILGLRTSSFFVKSLWKMNFTLKLPDFWPP